jgi:hypothetical protein
MNARAFPWRTVGGVAAIASLPIHLLVDHDISNLLAGLTLAMIGAIYIGFALTDGRRALIYTEALVAMLFLAASIASVLWSPWVAVGGFVAHGFWDFAHDHGVNTTMPRWYIPFCAFYDWVFALGFGAILLWKI